jgi:simple sugar transport system permease protein
MQSSADRIQLGLVTDVGNVDDGTFNQYTYEGLMRAVEEFDLDYELIETQSPDEFEAHLRELVERGCSHIVTIGSTKGGVVERVARRNPDVHFIIVDYDPLPDNENTTGLIFAEDQAGFLAGALAGLVTERGVVGFVGGVEVPPVLKFQRGFRRGVAHTNRRADVVQTYTESFTDREAGRAAGEELVERKADVVFAAGGRSGSAALQAAAQADAWVIGVDQDEWYTTFDDGDAPGADRLLTSAVKRVDNAVYSAIRRALEGELAKGVLRFDLTNDGVGLAPYHVADVAVPSEVRGRIQEVAEGLKDGRIQTHVGPQGEDLAQGLWARVAAWNWRSALMPVLAIFTALVIGGLFIAAFDPVVWEAFGEGILSGLSASVTSIAQAYRALFEGAFGSPSRIIEGFQAYIQTGEDELLLRGIRPLTESLRIATPYVFAGLAVALSFRAGLFNIGAEGQYFVGGLASVFVGYSLVGLPWFIHLPLAVGAGIAGGAAWAAIAGFLKAKTGAHEVITTIMLNYIAYRLADYLLQVGGPMARPGANLPVSPEIQPSAYLPQFFPDSLSIRLNVGLILAVLAVVFVYWLLFKTTIGFELRTVGTNPDAARTAGINVGRNIVLAMALSGGLAGLAGAHDILGVIHYMPNAFFSGYGFDSIALALLGKSRPVGVMLAAFLFGFLRSGAQRMQAPPALVPIDIISIVQALIIIFIAAPEVVRLLYRLRAEKEEKEVVFTRGWGKM